MKRKILAMVMSAVIAFPFVGFNFANAANTTQPNQVTTQNANINIASLDSGRWAPDTLKIVQTLIDENGIKNLKYDAKKKPYAIFDWDNTCAFNDVEETLLMYQINNLAFKMTPEEFSKAIRNTVPKDNFKDSYVNANKEVINIDKIGEDLDRDYKYLYENFEGFKVGGNKKLEELKTSEEFTDFKAKLSFLYFAIDETFGSDVSYTWVLYLLQNYTSDELIQLSIKSTDNALGESIKPVTYVSSSKLPGKSGVVSVDYKTGLRITPEISNLMNVFRNNGIDVYISSASHEDVVRAFASSAKYGYNVPKENVLGVKLEKKSDGKILPKIVDKKNWDINVKHGKTVNITKALKGKYGYDPLFIAGDSDGDYEMMTELSPKVVLIVNRLKGGNIGIVSKKASETLKQPNVKFVLQGRDENTGMWIPTEKTVKYGKNVEALIK